MWRTANRWTQSMQLYRRHPGARVMLFRRVFWNVWHYLWWRTLLAVALPPWARRAVVRRHLRLLAARAAEGGVHGAGLAWAVPFLWVHDGIECIAVIRGALRHRTPVL
jgi:hypothetical protein